MFWLLAIILSFNIIDALIPVIIILILIAAAAGLTRGTDIFALFGLGAIMGFANAGAGRTGRGLRGVRYGGDSSRRAKAAKRAKGGLFKRAKKIKKQLKASKSSAVIARRQQTIDRMHATRTKNAKFAQRRLDKLQAAGKGNSLRARSYKRYIDGVNKKQIKYGEMKKREKTIQSVSNQLSSLKRGSDVAKVMGGVTLATSSPRRTERINKKLEKTVDKKSKLTSELDAKNKNVEAGIKGFFDTHSSLAARYGINLSKNPSAEEHRSAFSKIANDRKTRIASSSEAGIRIGHVPKFTNVKPTTITAVSGTTHNVVKIPKSAFFQKGATTAIAYALWQKHLQKVITTPQGPGVGQSQKEREAVEKLNNLNKRITKQYYDKGGNVSKSAARLKNVVSFSLPIPLGGTVGKIIGKRFEEQKLNRLPDEQYSLYRDRVKEMNKVLKEQEENKAHTLRHPIKGVKGPNALEAKIKELNDSIDRTVRKNIK